MPTSNSTTLAGSTLVALNLAAPTTKTANSPYDLLVQSSGLVASKSNVCNGAGAQNDNLFTITGTVKVLGIWAQITQVTNGITLSGNSLEVYDSTASYEITDAGAPLDLSGVTEVGGIVMRNGASASVALVNLRVNVGGVTDVTSVPFYMWKKVGANTYVRHNFTGDADTNVTMTWYIHYVPISADGAVTAV